MSDNRIRIIWSWLVHPAVLAGIVTLANAAKPVVVDDTAYLLFARHIAANPSDPYGFELFWYREPEPAMNVLAPPVLTYWLAAAMRVVGESVPLLKLSLYPFALAFAFATRSLFRRFAPGTDSVLTAAVVLGPGVLPFLNLMLDVPALALYLSALAVFVYATTSTRTDWLAVAGAGLLAGLALQTKYSTLTVPALLVWYGLLVRKPAAALLCCSIGVAVFAGWEWFVFRTYNESHFLRHVGEQAVGSDAWGRVAQFFRERGGQIVPLLGQLGGTAGVLGLFGMTVLGARPTLTAGLLAVASLMVTAMLFLPARSTVVVAGVNPWDNPTTIAHLLFIPLGSGALFAGVIASVWLTTTRGRSKRLRLRRSPAGWFLAGWLVLEIAGCLALSPFPAGRRVLGVTVALAFAIGRLWALCLRRSPAARSLTWWPRAVVVSGFLLAAIDTWDARPEKEVAESAAEYIAANGPGGTVWYFGHWGFQYYCDRVGMKPIVPGRTAPRAGDWIVVPVYPDPHHFYRPDNGGIRLTLNPADVQWETEFVSDDALWVQTVPNLYGGGLPIAGRDHPRLRVALYRVIKPLRPIAVPPA